MAEIVRVDDILTSKTYVVVETEINWGLISHAGFRIRNIVRRYRIQLRFIGFPHALAAAVRALRMSLAPSRVAKQSRRELSRSD